MILNKFLKSISIIVCTILISVSSVSISYANDHSPRWEKINELKKEIIDLGGKPEKRKHILSSLSKWIEKLEVQLEKLKKIDAIKGEIKKELEALGEKPLSEEAKELEADEEIIALRKLLEDVKAKKKEAEEKKKKDAKIAVAIEMLKDEIASLGEEPIIDTSDIDSDETIKALKKQIADIKKQKKEKKAEAKKKQEEKAKAEEKKQTRLKAIEGVKKEILFMGETPMSEYEFTSEDEYIAALRKQVEELKKLKEEEEFKINAEIPDWYQSPPASSETVLYSRGNGISADLDNSEQRAIENALIKLAQQLNNRINRKVNIMAKEAGVDGDLVLKRETERITSIVIKDASIKGYKVYKTKMALLANGKYTTFIMIEYPVSLAYKNFITEIDTNVTVKAQVNKLKNTEAFKELEQYVAEFSGA
ncbi:LPP20 family lipoprotein [Pelagibacterales bacterium SAG-MED50]|nr:LPP20 family lipoprotein [Pelagibacterales bacterium SAG-MED50]